MSFFPRRGLRHSEKQTTRSANLLDYLSVIKQNQLSILPIASQKELTSLGKTQSGYILQALSDASTSLAFKQAPWSSQNGRAREIDFDSLITEVAVLRHPPIQRNRHIINIVGATFSVSGIATVPQLAAVPVTVTRKAELGDLSSLVADRKRPLPSEMRWQLFMEVVEAIYVLHSCGVAHGDIKPKNIVIAERGGETFSQLIDFGSCIIKGRTRSPCHSPPWHAPELEDHPDHIDFARLSQADLFSLGLVCVHVLIPRQTLVDAGLFLIDGENYRDCTIQELAARLLQVTCQAGLAPDRKKILDDLITSTIAAVPGSRTIQWNNILRSAKSRVLQERVENWGVKPPPQAGHLESDSHEEHTRFELEQWLEDLDDTHYIVRQEVFKELKKAYGACAATCSICRKTHAFTLAVAYRIGFGCQRGEERISELLQSAERTQSDLDDIIRRIGEAYQGTNRVAADVLQQLDMPVVQGSNRVYEYQQAQRLEEARKWLTIEVEARAEAFGPDSLCLVRLSGELSLIHRYLDDLDKAEECQQAVVRLFQKSPGGEQHPSTMFSRIMLSQIWSGQGFIPRAIADQESCIPVLQQTIGMGHPDTLVAKQIHANTLALSGDMDGAEKVCQDITDTSAAAFGSQHPLSINATFVHFTIMRLNGHLDNAARVLERQQQILKNLPDKEEPKIRFHMAQAHLEKDRWDLEAALQSIDVLQQNIPRKYEAWKSARLGVLEMKASIHQARQEYQKEEECLNQILKEANGALEMRVLEMRALEELSRNFLWQGRYADALQKADEVIRETGVAPPCENPFCYLSCEEVAAFALAAQNRCEDAERRLARAYENCRAGLGQGHNATVQAACQLADYRHMHRRFLESQCHLLVVSKDMEQATQKSAMRQRMERIVPRLSIASSEAGLVEEALSLCNEAVNWCKMAGREKTRSALWASYALGYVCLRRGEHADAESILLDIEPRCREPKLLLSIKMVLREVRSYQGRHEEALQLAREAQQLSARVGTIPADSLIIQSTVLLERLYAEGISSDLENECWKNIRDRDPAPIVMMVQLAYKFAISNRCVEAKSLLSEIELLGGVGEMQQPLEHATALCQMAETCASVHAFEKAEQYGRKGLEIRREKLGEDHRLVLKAKSNLASTLFSLQRYSEAELLLRTVLCVCENDTNVPLRSQDSYERLNLTRKDLAAVCFKTGRLEESLSLFEEALNGMIEFGGSPDIIGNLFDNVSALRKILGGT